MQGTKSHGISKSVYIFNVSPSLKNKSNPTDFVYVSNFLKQFIEETNSSCIRVQRVMVFPSLFIYLMFHSHLNTKENWGEYCLKGIFF